MSLRDRLVEADWFNQANDNAWSYLGYELACWGIPSDDEETVTDDYEFDPWRPAPGGEAVRIVLAKKDAGRLAALLEAVRDETNVADPIGEES